MRAPYFSIVTVTKNNLKGLKETAASIAAQDNSDWGNHEWIIIDGNSDDGSEAFLKKTNAHWISAPDDGLYDAMNKGIERAHGVYIIFMNAGDVFADETVLSELQNDIDEPLPDLIYGDALEEGKDGHDYYKYARSHKHIDKGMFTHHQSIFYKREKIGPLRYDLNYKLAADYDFTARFLKRNPYAIYFDRPICLFETGGLSQRNAGQSRSEEFHIRQEMNVPMVKNILVTARQMAAQLIRQFSNPLYWKIRENF